MEHILLGTLLHTLSLPVTVQNNVCEKLINTLPIQCERWVTDTQSEGEKLAEEARDLTSLLRRSSRHLCRGRVCCMEL